MEQKDYSSNKDLQLSFLVTILLIVAGYYLSVDVFPFIRNQFIIWVEKRSVLNKIKSKQLLKEDFSSSIINNKNLAEVGDLCRERNPLKPSQAFILKNPKRTETVGQAKALTNIIRKRDQEVSTKSKNDTSDLKERFPRQTTKVTSTSNPAATINVNSRNVTIPASALIGDHDNLLIQQQNEEYYQSQQEDLQKKKRLEKKLLEEKLNTESIQKALELRKANINEAYEARVELAASLPPLEPVLISSTDASEDIITLRFHVYVTGLTTSTPPNSNTTISSGTASTSVPPPPPATTSSNSPTRHNINSNSNKSKKEFTIKKIRRFHLHNTTIKMILDYIESELLLSITELTPEMLFESTYEVFRATTSFTNKLQRKYDNQSLAESEFISNEVLRIRLLISSSTITTLTSNTIE